MSRIVAIGTALPEHEMQQMDVYTFMQKVYAGTTIDEQKRLKLLYERSGIQKRYSTIPDYNISEGKRILYPKGETLEPFPSLEKRMELYHAFAGPLAKKAIRQAFDKTDLTPNQITHLITVSCTGMSAPGLDLQLMESLQLNRNTERTSVNFMGCYAAVHALKMAHSISQANTNAVVCVVCVELCTLHFQKTFNYDNLTANAIFADGAAACIITNKVETKDSLKLKSFYSEVNSDGKKDMAWQLSSYGFLMTLSSYIPQIIESNIEQLLDSACTQFQLSMSEVKYWAIHPGGRKILDVICSKLNLKNEELIHSYNVLKEFGNMSSPTILFVLDRHLNDAKIHGDIIGAAFGPGLTMETFHCVKN